MVYLFFVIFGQRWERMNRRGIENVVVMKAVLDNRLTDNRTRPQNVGGALSQESFRLAIANLAVTNRKNDASVGLADN